VAVYTLPVVKSRCRAANECNLSGPRDTSTDCDVTCCHANQPSCAHNSARDRTLVHCTQVPQRTAPQLSLLSLQGG